MKPDYCPMVNEPCQSMCDTPCSMNRLETQQRKPMTGTQMSLDAHNIDPGDWNDLRFRDAWHSGFNAGFRAAESAHGIGGMP